ncbi:Tyrosine recombinase XerC protein [Salinisphaera shabanensis E1L3A]|uniref:Tyrosine recombinase XerC protein n=2 Tax=Salinisphaera shabanensis TaxID=180542 RepID=U2EP65_9GAMM|nr:Tyrosine recombinase XerC protein [Salinisphaera shabanensis E1L3A]
MFDTGVLAPAEHNRSWSVPMHLAGEYGRNRASLDRVQIAAVNDLEAIAVWLAEFADTPATFRSYRKEAERLVLWSAHQRQCAVSDLTREDLRAYQAFLAQPTPAATWCGGRAARTSADWRPFRGPLQPNSQAQALTILNAMFSYLVAASYLSGNPLALARGDAHRLKKSRSSKTQVERFLEADLWRHVLAYIEAMPTRTTTQAARRARTRYIFSMLYLLGARVSEFANSTMGAFEVRRGHWWWHVRGKGGVSARIPANTDTMTALARYREFNGLSATPAFGEQTPLVLNLKGDRGISADMVYRVVKKTCRNAALRLAQTNSAQAAKLDQATTHWLRHTAITHQADRAIELRFLNKSARHAKLETTGLYLHADDADWSKAMERHRLSDAEDSSFD